MKRTRPLLLLVGAVASLACVSRVRARGRTHTRRPRIGLDRSASRASWWVVPAALTVGSPSSWNFDPGAVWGGIWSFLGNIGSDIKAWVLEAIQKAGDFIMGIVNLVDDTYRAVTHALGAGVQWLTDNAINAKNAVEHVIEGTYHIIDDWATNIRRQIQDLLDHAWDDLKKWILDPAGDFLKGVFGEGWDIVKKLIALGLDGVDFLIALATDPFGTIWHLIEQAVKDTIGFALPPLEWIVQTGLDIIFAGYGDIIDVLKKCWDILYWIATHIDEISTKSLYGILTGQVSAIEDDVYRALALGVMPDNDRLAKTLGLDWVERP